MCGHWTAQEEAHLLDVTRLRGSRSMPTRGSQAEEDGSWLPIYVPSDLETSKVKGWSLIPDRRSLNSFLTAAIMIPDRGGRNLVVVPPRRERRPPVARSKTNFFRHCRPQVILPPKLPHKVYVVSSIKK
jgi:hypothetical protein